MPKRTGREPATLGEQIRDLNLECFWYTYPPEFAREAVHLLYVLAGQIPKELFEGPPIDFNRDEWASRMRDLSGLNVDVSQKDGN